MNALVRDFLGRYVHARCRRLEALDRFEAVAAASAEQTGERPAQLVGIRKLVP